LQLHDGPQATDPILELVPVQLTLHAPPPHVTSLLRQLEVPEHWTLHGADVGHWILMPMQVLGCAQSTSHDDDAGHWIGPAQAEADSHSTWHRIPGGHTSPVLPH
jgi:hypothetical protein